MSERLPGLQGLKPSKREARPPRLPDLPVVYAVGPESAGLRQAVRVTTGPGDPPPGFVTGSTSKSEWWIYWALAKVFDDPKDPRQRPYFGGVNWGYQIAFLGAYARAPGSAVVDFLVYLPHERVGLRLVSRYWHIAQTPHIRAADRVQRVRLEGDDVRVVDLFEDDFVDDETGQAAVLVCKQALGFWERIDPFSSARSLARG